MARYGIDFYGASVYGSPQSLVSFDATPLEVLPYAPAQNIVRWTIPSGDYTRMRLVRNAYGWPVHEDDGQVLLDLNCGPAAVAPLDAPTGEYFDIDLQIGRLYYYSVFVLAYDSTLLHDEWQRAADGTGISIGAYNYTERMLDLLPEVYWSDPNDPSGRNDQLVRFLSIFGNQLDQIRSQYESLRYLHNPDKVAAALLAPLGDMFGVHYEPEIGAHQHRAMVRNAVFINKRKGTRLGTNTLVSSFTGWDAQIAIGVNLMLDYNDSSFEEFGGRWEAGGASGVVSWRAADGTVAAFQASDFTNKQAGLLQLTANAGSGYAVLGLRHPIASGIPVTAGLTYTVSGYARSAVTPRQFDIQVRWFGPHGATISDSGYGTAGTSTTSGWTRVSVTDTAPAGAVYAGLMVRVSATGANEVHYLDAVQFEQGSVVTAFQEARDVRITLHADRINEIPNPSAEVDTTGWTAASGTVLSRDTSIAFSGDLTSTTPTTTVGSPNSASFKLVPTTTTPGSSGGASTTHGGAQQFMAVTAGEDYSASAYLYGAVNGQLQLRFYAADDTLLTTTTGLTFSWVVNQWVRADVTATAPDTTSYATVTVVPLWSGLTSPALWFDQVLCEQSAEVRPYFDASQFHTRPADNLWEGTAHASRSHYYFNRTAKQFRLDALLNDYLLPGHTHTLLVAQPFAATVDQLNEDSVGSYGNGPYGAIAYL